MLADQKARGLRLSFRSRLPLAIHSAIPLALTLLAFTGKARAANFDALFAGTNDFGDVGLMQTPTARMRPDGDFGLGISTVRPDNQVDIFVQPLPWLETSIHYVDITNRFYSSDPSFSGNQHYKHRGVDGKIRLLNEGEYYPALAVGAQDAGGTGLFSSEYLVSSYHYYDFDFSFGLGWGRLGSRGGIRNPFALISNHFDQNRYASANDPGALNSGRLFSGHDIGPFGGVEWNTPIKGLAVRVEYDGNNYQHEALGDNLRQDSPVNVGIAYRGVSGIDMGVGLERGNTIMARFAIYTNFNSMRGVAKTGDPSLPPAHKDDSIQAQPSPTAAPPQTVPAVTVRAAPGAAEVPGAITRTDEAERNAFILSLREGLKQQGFAMIAVDYDSYQQQVRLWLSQDKYRNPAKAVGRTARVLSATAPAEISKFTLIFVDRGVENYRADINRVDFEKAAHDNDPDAALLAVVLGGADDRVDGAQYFDITRLPKFSWDMGPAVRQSVGGPDAFYAGQLYWKLASDVALTDHLSVSGAAGFNIINNFNQIKLQSNSTLPHVRSDIVKYLQQGGDGLINLEADYIWSPYADWYHRLSAGIFEEMYAGISSELLYRPYGRSWAVALDVNRVKQRGYDEAFDFLPYIVTTGHLALYYKPRYYNLLFKLSIGQYLARDRGGTLDISREFQSGVRVGLFATKTNVSAAQFGEGSFDKGVYISLPLDLFFNRSTRREAGFTFRPLTRDGGQMVYDGPELYFTLQGGQPEDMAKGAGEILK